MGECKHCKRQIILKDGEKNCPNCGQSPYNCWNCQNEITGETEECSFCHFFTCSDCDKCGPNCITDDLLMEGISRFMIEKIKKLLQKPDRLECHKGVPISYGHQKLRNLALRLQGHLTKNETDRAAFEERVEAIEGFAIGKTWNINKVKEAGAYGTEWREASNMAICMGLARKFKKREFGKNGKVKKEWEEFERIKIKACPYSNWNKLISKYCDKCKTTFDIETTACPNCVYKKGKHKGEQRELRKRASNAHFCSKNRNEYQRKKELKNG